MLKAGRRADIPTVFISSTSEDLKPYRQSAKEAAISARFHPEMMEYFVASGHNPPLSECLSKVEPADVLVVIVAHRYGWVPLDQPPKHFKSITWLECEHAVKQGIEVLAFLVEESGNWPSELKESYRITAAVEAGTDTPELLAEVRSNVASLKELKQWLNRRAIRATFSNPDELRGKVESALREWRQRNPAFAEIPVPERIRSDDPTRYLEFVREQTAWIDIRGLQVGTGKAHRFPIEDLYIPLTTSSEAIDREGAGDGQRRKESIEGSGERRFELQDALTRRRLVIVGEPGAGKTTFLRRVAFALSDEFLRESIRSLPAVPPDAVAAGTDFLSRLKTVFRRSLDAVVPAGDQRPIPIFIRIAELAEHIHKCHLQPGRPTTEESPGWLIDFLNTRNNDLNWGLREIFFRGKLESGSCVLLLDGLDEAPGRLERESVARLFENATSAYHRCRFVVSTRPLAYAGQTILAGFQTAHIEPLETEAIEKFLQHWCQALFPESAPAAQRHLGELSEALRARAEIRRMARNPVMLTALAVVHWNERRLPEQRADLYDSILNWLARTREKRPGREPAERCLMLLQNLALAMLDHPAGRQVQVSKRWAGERLAQQFTGDLRLAESFVEQEEVDSGIIVSRGSDIRFWHLTFHEYLAARAIAGMADADQHSLLLSGNKIYKPEWRETALLLAGVLRVRQGPAKVDGLFAALLDRLGRPPTLAEQARCAGLLGAMVRDLQPLDYQPADPRYADVLKAVLGIFDAQKAASVDFQVRLEAAEALGQAGDPRLDKDNWVTIEAGEFWMGAQKTDPSGPNYDPEAETEGPVHRVDLDRYQIARYPVTVAEYQRFIDGEGYQDQRWWRAGGFGDKREPGAGMTKFLTPIGLS